VFARHHLWPMKLTTYVYSPVLLYKDAAF
jgi:hypothetical protein